MIYKLAAKLLKTAHLLIAFSMLCVLPVQVTAATSAYDACEDLPTLRSILDCRARVAEAINESKGLSSQDLFQQPSFLDPTNFSLISWVTLGMNIFILGLLVYWVILIIGAVIKMIGSLGNAEKIAEAGSQIGAVLKSIAALFIFLLIMILVGNFFGIGNIWDWPNSFRQCSNYGNKFYFTVALENPGQPFVCN